MCPAPINCLHEYIHVDPRGLARQLVLAKGNSVT